MNIHGQKWSYNGLLWVNFISKQSIQKAIHFLFAQIAVLSSFFQVFKVLGMYNFEGNPDSRALEENPHAPVSETH